MRGGARGASASVEKHIGGGRSHISHHKPLSGMGRNEFSWGMPKPSPRVPHVESPFVLRAELLTVVPHSMATIDRLEAKGRFPKRIRLEPTTRVAWLRREVTAYLRHLAKGRHSAVQEDHVKAANQQSKKSSDPGLSPAQSERSGPALEDQPADPGHQLAPALAQTWRPDRITERRGCDDD